MDSNSLLNKVELLLNRNVYVAITPEEYKERLLCLGDIPGAKLIPAERSKDSFWLIPLETL